MTQTPTQSPLDAKGLEAAFEEANSPVTVTRTSEQTVEAVIRAYLASQEAAEPSEEPVAWQHRTKGRYEGAHWGAWLEGRANFTKLDYEERPLFASPAVAPVAVSVKAETGWLIELRGNEPKWWSLDYNPEPDWTKDASRALRFARKDDADAYIGEVGWTEAFASEHEWPAHRPHDWFEFKGMKCCRSCGNVWNATSDTRSCKGRVKVELRSSIIPATKGGVTSELRRAANALINNLWIGVVDAKLSHEENWREFDRRFPGVKWLHDELAALSQGIDTEVKP